MVHVASMHHCITFILQVKTAFIQDNDSPMAMSNDNYFLDQGTNWKQNGCICFIPLILLHQ